MGFHLAFSKFSEAERQLGVSEDGSCSSTRSVVRPQVANLMKPTTH